MERTGAAAAWRLVEGALRVDIGNFSARYRKLGDGPLGEERWTFEPLDAAGLSTDISEIMSVRASPVTLVAADWAKRWAGNLNAGFGILTIYDLKSDGSLAAAQLERGETTPATTSNRFWRQLPDARIEVATGNIPGTGPCNVFLATAGCTLFRQNFWTALGRNGKTLWVMEQGPYAVPTGNGFENSWRLVALTDTSTNP